MGNYRMFTPGSVMFVGAIIVAIGAFWNFISQEKQVERTLGFITGGNSYCYFEYTSANHGPLEVNLLLNQEGEYPVYDIETDVYEVDKHWKAISVPVANIDSKLPAPPIKKISIKIIHPHTNLYLCLVGIWVKRLILT